MAKMTEMKDLLTHELADLLYAERRFLTGTRRMSKEAQDPEIRSRLEQHVKETETQIERLGQAFSAIGEKAKAEKCEAAIGLREEHDSFKSEEKPSSPILQAFDLGSGLRVEHYEIAAYRSAIAVAKVLGENECAAILKDSLTEEEAMANFLEQNASRALRKLKAEAQEE
jgi:ferritin-like metal-binding protein YciE